MASQGRAAGGSWQPGRTQESRGLWQRQAAGALRELVDGNGTLPAFTWSVSRSGYLSGWAGEAIAPRMRRPAFLAWQQSLELPAARLSPGGGTTRRLRAHGLWGAVPIALAANVEPVPGEGDLGSAVPPPASGTPVTFQEARAACALVTLLESHGDVPAASWQVLPYGAIIGQVRARTPADGLSQFAAWRLALGLSGVAETLAGREDLTRLVGSATVDGVDVTMSAVMPVARWPAFPQPGGRRARREPDLSWGQSRAPERGSPGPAIVSLPPRHDGGPRGPVQRP